MYREINNKVCKVLKRIEIACRQSNRNPDEVKLLLATKTVAPEQIKIALKSGQLLIAENRVQELKQKYPALCDIEHTSHFIGHLQTNKIKDLLKYNVACIQSLDRLDLAEKLQHRLVAADKTMEILVQVNTSNEGSKFGVRPDETVEFVQEVAKMDRLQINGLMTIGLFSAETEKVRPCFRVLKNLQQQISTLEIPHVSMKELSMGMSNDLEVAIEEGATMIRVGTAIFGQRIYPDSYYWNEKK